MALGKSFKVYLGGHSAECVVADGRLTIKSKIGTRTIDAGESANVAVGLAQQQLGQMVDQHETKGT
jgi:hypothetical protein